MDSKILFQGLRVVGVLSGFLGGFLILAGIYGFVFPDRLVQRGLPTVPISYLVSTALVGAGIVGLYLQRYIKHGFE